MALVKAAVCIAAAAFITCLTSWATVVGVITSTSYRRHPTKNLRLGSFFREQTGPSHWTTRTSCASACTAVPSCLVYSYQLRAEKAEGICRLGKDPAARESALTSAVYSKSIRPARGIGGWIYPPDGNAYKKISTSVSSLTSARTTCTNIGLALPNPYQNDAVQMQLENMLKPGDTVYLDFTGYLAGVGSSPQRIFTTSAGLTFNATQGSSDDNDGQHWRPGQPDAAANSSAAAVVMTYAGWDDVPANTIASSVICVGLGNGYQLEASGHWFRMSTNKVDQNGAFMTCYAEGASLAWPYGTPVTAGVILKYSRLVPSFYVDGYKSPTQGTTWHFTDGSTASDWDFNWLPPNPEKLVGEDCLIVCSSSAQLCDCYCPDTFRFLCQRPFS